MTSKLLKLLETDQLSDETKKELLDTHNTMKAVATCLSEFIANTILLNSIVRPSSSIVAVFTIFSNLSKHLLHESSAALQGRRLVDLLLIG